MSKSSDIRQKEVINVTNGSKMGLIADMEFSPDGHIRSFTVPGPFSLSGLFRQEKGGVVVPWEHVWKIGEDVILVEVDPEEVESMELRRRRE